MKLRIAVSLLLAISFLAIGLDHRTSQILHVGSWVAGVTEPKWHLYILFCIASSFLVCFFPQFRNYQVLLCAPLIVMLICKALSILLVLFYLSLSVQTYIFVAVGFILSGLFLVHFYLSGGSARIAIFIWVFTVIGIAPVAHEFTEKMVNVPLTNTSNSLRFAAPDAHCVRAV